MCLRMERSCLRSPHHLAGRMQVGIQALDAALHHVLSFGSRKEPLLIMAFVWEHTHIACSANSLAGQVGTIDADVEHLSLQHGALFALLRCETASETHQAQCLVPSTDSEELLAGVLDFTAVEGTIAVPPVVARNLFGHGGDTPQETSVSVTYRRLPKGKAPIS